MGNFGKGKEIQFFMTEIDEKKFFKEIFDKFNVRCVINSKNIYNLKNIPEDDHCILNITKNNIKFDIDYQKSRNVNSKIIMGIISTLFTYFINEVEIPEPEYLFELWNKIDKYIKNNFIKFVFIQDLDKKRKFYVYVGEDAFKLYGKGYRFVDFLNSPNTFHPNHVSKMELKKGGYL